MSVGVSFGSGDMNNGLVWRSPSRCKNLPEGWRWLAAGGTGLQQMEAVGICHANRSGRAGRRLAGHYHGDDFFFVLPIAMGFAAVDAVL